MERWRPPDGGSGPIDTCTIITTAANALVAPIHERMPVILAERDYARWLDRAVGAADGAALLRPCPDGELRADRVSRVVNSPRNDTPECVAPLVDEPPA